MSIKCNKCVTGFKAFSLSDTVFSAEAQLAFHEELNHSIVSINANYMLFSRTTEERDMNVSNINIVYVGETGEGLTRTLTTIFRLDRVSEPELAKLFENQFDLVVSQQTLRKNLLYLTIVRTSDKITMGIR